MPVTTPKPTAQSPATAAQRIEARDQADALERADLLLPGFLLEPLIVEELASAGDVLVVELDAHVAGEPVGFGVPAGEPDELGLRNGHALTFECKVDRALLDDRVDVLAPRVAVHEDIDKQPLLLVQDRKSVV